MLRSRSTVLVLLLALTAAGIAVGAESTFEELSHGLLVPSAQPGLLAPITEAGRTGWACAPERAARARTARGAELPPDER